MASRNWRQSKCPVHPTYLDSDLDNAHIVQCNVERNARPIASLTTVHLLPDIRFSGTQPRNILKVHPVRPGRRARGKTNHHPVRQRSCPIRINLALHRRRSPRRAKDTRRLAKSILVDVDNPLVPNNSQRPTRDLVQIQPQHQRRLGNSPQPEMDLLLVAIDLWRPKIQHVQIVEPPRPAVLIDVRRRATNPLDARPIPPVIDAHPPRVAVVGAPGPDVVPPPVAQVEVHLFYGLGADDGVAHGRVPRAAVAGGRVAGLRARVLVAGGVAVVVFPEVDAPGGELRDVGLFAAFGAGVAGAGLLAGAAVEAEFEAEGVDLVDDGLDSVGPFAGVGDELAGGVAGFGGPAVVDVYVWGRGVSFVGGDGLRCGIWVVGR